eukprot:scaffold39237_cov66-Phaeocystis_antarctica.AAC.1
MRRNLSRLVTGSGGLDLVPWPLSPHGAKDCRVRRAVCIGDAEQVRREAKGQGQVCLVVGTVAEV